MASKFIFFRNYIFSVEDASIDMFVPSKKVDNKDVYDKYWIGLH